MKTGYSNAIYYGKVMHKRQHPKINAFQYGAYFLFLDINQLDELAKKFRFFSHNSANISSLYDKDHGPRNGEPLDPWFRGMLSNVKIDLEGGQIMLLTFPRAFWFHFFPASFWFCFHKDGTLRAVMAEVNNTFHQHHNYLLHKNGEPLSWKEKIFAQKVFHVSPFIQMDEVRYIFQFSEPKDNLSIIINEPVEGKILLKAKVKLERRELTDKQIIRTFIRYGPMSARARLFIYWQAIKIFSKGIKYIPKPELPEEEISF